MSDKELSRINVIQSVVEKRMRRRDAAHQLALTERQTQRLMNRFSESGAAGLANLRRGSPGNHRLPESLKLRVLTLLHDHYSDFGPTLAAEKIDGSPHDWFEGRAPKCCLLVLIEDTEYSRRAIGKYIDVWHYPDGHKELRLHGVLLPYSTYDRLSEVDPVAIVDNKRLGHVLDVARQVQRKRDNNSSQSLPSSGDEPSRRRHAPSINKSQRSLNEEDLLEAMIKLQGSSEAIFGKR
ncbi:helix-turn-helix domain-containing protein [Escherichia coli]|nr:helix-turn-helix domain-containing protein [Escherichia coli]